MGSLRSATPAGNRGGIPYADANGRKLKRAWVAFYMVLDVTEIRSAVRYRLKTRRETSTPELVPQPWHVDAAPALAR